MSRRDTYYFPHEYNAKDDPKCERLISVMGMEGYGIFWALLETLRAQPGYTYPLANIPIVAHKYYTTPELMRHVIFDFGLFTIVEDKIFFSNGLLNRMQPMDELRKKKSDGGKKGMANRWGNNLVNNSLNNIVNNNKIIEDKSKEDIKKLSIESKESADRPRNGTAKRTAFVVPSPQEVKDYISEKGYTVDAQRFIDFYEAKGWMIGKNKMKDWRAAVRTWMRRPDEPQKQTTYEMRKTNFL